MKNLQHCPTCPQQMRRGSTGCSACRAREEAPEKRAAMLERRRARYADEIEGLEWYVRQLTLTDEDYRVFFRNVPREVVEERLRRTQERLDWVLDRCGLA